MTHKRKETDISILNNGKITGEDLRSWIGDLFFGNEMQSFHVSGDVFDLWVSEVLKGRMEAENEKIVRMILVKVLHTKEVVEAGLDIMHRTGEVDWDPYAVGTVCLLHDLGRFRQALLGSYSDIETNFDHADYGASLIEKEELPEMESLGIQKSVISEAVRAHSRISYLGDDAYAKITRDADKLALLRYMPYLIDTKRFPHGQVTKEAVEAYKKRILLENKYMKGYGDVLLSWLCWEEDLNFLATKEAFTEEGIKDWILSEIEKENIKI